jgi:hypothetical protein
MIISMLRSQQQSIAFKGYSGPLQNGQRPSFASPAAYAPFTQASPRFGLSAAPLLKTSFFVKLIELLTENPIIALIVTDIASMVLPRTYFQAKLHGIESGRETLFREAGGTITNTFLGGLMVWAGLNLARNPLLNAAGLDTKAYIEPASHKMIQDMAFNMQAHFQNHTQATGTQIMERYLDEVLGRLRTPVTLMDEPLQIGKHTLDHTAFSEINRKGFLDDAAIAKIKAILMDSAQNPLLTLEEKVYEKFLGNAALQKEIAEKVSTFLQNNTAQAAENAKQAYQEKLISQAKTRIRLELSDTLFSRKGLWKSLSETVGSWFNKNTAPSPSPIDDLIQKLKAISGESLLHDHVQLVKDLQARQHDVSKGLAFYEDIGVTSMDNVLSKILNGQALLARHLSHPETAKLLDVIESPAAKIAAFVGEKGLLGTWKQSYPKLILLPVAITIAFGVTVTLVNRWITSRRTGRDSNPVTEAVTARIQGDDPPSEQKEKEVEKTIPVYNNTSNRPPVFASPPVYAYQNYNYVDPRVYYNTMPFNPQPPTQNGPARFFV